MDNASDHAHSLQTSPVKSSFITSDAEEEVLGDRDSTDANNNCQSFHDQNLHNEMIRLSHGQNQLIDCAFRPASVCEVGTSSYGNFHPFGGSDSLSLHHFARLKADSVGSNLHSSLMDEYKTRRLLSNNGSQNPRQRDEKRRVTHNEVERRRRDKINGWIFKIAKLMPECTDDFSKHGQSKGGILAKAYDHIQDMSKRVDAVNQVLRQNEILNAEVSVYKKRVEELSSEVQRLRLKLLEHESKERNA